MWLTNRLSSMWSPGTDMNKETQKIYDDLMNLGETLPMTPKQRDVLVRAQLQLRLLSEQVIDFRERVYDE